MGARLTYFACSRPALQIALTALLYSWVGYHGRQNKARRTLPIVLICLSATGCLPRGLQGRCRFENVHFSSVAHM